MAGLAEVLGVTEKSVTNYESGRREPDWDTLERIAQATGRDVAWFFQEEAPAESPESAPAPPAPSATDAQPQTDLAAAIAQAVAQAMAPLVQAQVRSETRLGRIEGLLYHQRDILERQGETQEAILDELRQENQEGCCGHDDQRGAA